MSTTTPEWYATSFEGEQLRDDLQALLDRACPDRPLLSQMGTALMSAIDDASSEYHPYLDPDAFWYQVAWPRCDAVVSRCSERVDEWARGVREAVNEQQRIFADRAALAGFEALNGDSQRDVLVAQVVECCEKLHRAIEAAGGFVIERTTVDAISAQLTQHRTREGGDGAEALRATLPWRHQELLIEAHRQAVEMTGQRRDHLVAELIAQIMPMGEAAVEDLEVALAPN